uniref:Transmembrane protease serine 9-like protein n=1 Tax=Rhipicephalus zambeziensis TaxID=60191 RepID=A0A224YPR8_9ACAR
MIHFVVGVSLLLGSSSSVYADGLQINEPECGMPTRGMIVNGSIAEPNQFPWMVYLVLHFYDGRTFGCGGSILTKLHILTAAHCTHDDKRRPFKRIDVYYGNTDRTRAKILRVTKMISHPKYDNHRFINDIAVLVVDRPFEYGSNARPICIPTAPMNITNMKTIVAGWGLLQEGGNPTNRLRYTTVRVVTEQWCSKVYPQRFDGYVEYCAYRKGTDSCQVDSGGPAIVRVDGGRYVQVGILSYGTGCAREYEPGVYARVDVFIPWLKQVVGSLAKAYSSQVRLQLKPYIIPQWPRIYQFP